MKLTGLILAGGKSSRMGTNKCMLELGKRTLIQIVAETLSVHCDEVLVIAKDQIPYNSTGLEVVTEVNPVQSPLVGLLTGLESASNELCIAVACDMPFLHVDSLKMLVDNSQGYDAVVPSIDGFPEPLHALYRKETAKTLLGFNNLEVRFTDFLAKINVKYLERETFELHDSQLLSFMNINTEEDYQKAKEIERSV